VPFEIDPVPLYFFKRNRDRQANLRALFSILTFSDPGVLAIAKSLRTANGFVIRTADLTNPATTEEKH
jgi:hypothetical protein